MSQLLKFHWRTAWFERSLTSLEHKHLPKVFVITGVAKGIYANPTNNNDDHHLKGVTMLTAAAGMPNKTEKASQ